MKNFLLLPVLFAALPFLQAQEKGASPITNHQSPSTGTTRAVVVGISDYADDRIPDLQYAHRDAEAFASYLASPAGGSLPETQIMLHTNEQATLGKMVAAFDWLIAKSRPGDRALIYFSGHGDVEKVTKFNRGYLLAYDMPAHAYMSGGLNLRDLQDIISTLSDAGVQVVMISDACRAGKLAGSGTGGTQATAAELARQFANEVKILSCQPEQYSIEGPQWGGGRGCFSYHLTDGLTGLADSDANRTVDLLEIGRYLQDRVRAEADPHRQLPMIVGDAYTAIATVDDAALADLVKRKEKESPTLLTIKSKGMEDLLLANTDTSVQALYRAFTDALDRGELMTSAMHGNAANDYFERLMAQPGIEDLQGMVKRNFAAALQDESQVVINKLLRTDPQVVDDAFPGRVRYAHLPAYLARAAEILGERHYMYRYLKCKQYFFEAKTYSKNTYPDLSPDSLFKLSIQALDKALGYDSTAAYVYFEKGLNFYWKVSKYAESHSFFQRTTELSPGWVLALYYYGRTLWHTGDAALGIAHLKDVVQQDSTFLPAYERLGFFAEDSKEKNYWLNSYIQKMEQLTENQPEAVPATWYRYLAWACDNLDRRQEMERAAQQFGVMTNYEDPIYWKLMGICLLNSERYEEAKKACERYIELRPRDPEIYQTFVEIYLQCDQPEKAVQFCENVLEGDSKNKFCALFMAAHWMGNIEYKKALEILEQSVDAQADKREHYLWLAKMNEHLGRKDIAADYYQKLLQDERNDVNTSFYQMFVYTKLGPVEKFQEAYLRNEKESIPYYPTPELGIAYALFYKSAVYGFHENKAQCLATLEQAFQKGLKLPDPVNSTYWGSLHAPWFMFVRNTPEFKALVKKYLPEYYKE